MNKLVIIGNGFDLAHGMKTSYSDFMTEYINSLMKKAQNELYFQDENFLFELNKNRANDVISGVSDFIQNHTIISSNAILENKGSASHRNRILLHKKNNFLFTLLERQSKNWFDIEFYYYRVLRAIAEKSENPAINVLQNNFEKIKTMLRQYLNSLPIPDKIPEIQILVDSAYREPDYKNTNPQNYFKTLYLNFNYTETIKMYITKPNSINMIINIHGDLHDNPIIFGYGDEHGEGYNDIEKLNENTYLTNVKSFGYLQNENYNKLMNFINEDQFETFIWGHSCSITDRTLLKRILQDEKNKFIKIFFYQYSNGYDDFNSIAMNLSRHFSNKDTFRTKVYDKQHSPVFPQQK